jgi:hypothetical protein
MTMHSSAIHHGGMAKVSVLDNRGKEETGFLHAAEQSVRAAME